MTMEINRKAATVLFVLALTSLKNGVLGQCVQNPMNLCVLEGTPNSFLPCAPNPDQVKWVCYPTSDELDDGKINDELGVIPGDLQSLYRVDSKGLWINKATILEETFKFSSAGIFIGEHGNQTRLVGAKLVVVRDGPVCTLNVASPENGVPVTLNCTTSYADHSVHPIRPIFEITVGDTVIVNEVIYPVRINQYIFVAWRSVDMDYNACLAITVKLTFDRPTDLQYDFIATNKPDYTNTFTFPATSTACLTDGANIAVLEGATNLLVGSSRNPQMLQRKISPCNEQLETYTISDFQNGVLANMTQYFSQDKTGLTISTATAVAGPNKITTAGIYTEKDRSGKVKGFKVIVVRGAPTCTKDWSDSNPPKSGDSVKLTCTSVFADHSLHQIAPRFTLQQNNVARSTTTPTKTRTTDETFSATASFTVSYDAAATFKCVFGFDPPPSGDGYDYMATNAPKFTASCQY